MKSSNSKIFSQMFFLAIFMILFLFFSNQSLDITNSFLNGCNLIPANVLGMDKALNFSCGFQKYSGS